jgi:hypothetical protein
VRLGDCQPNTILKASQPKMAARGDVSSFPNDVGVESHHPTRPSLGPSNCPLQHEFVDFEEKSFVFGVGLRWLSPIGAREKNVADPNQLSGSYWI